MDYDILPIEACRCHTNGHVANGNFEPDVNLIAQFSHASSSCFAVGGATANLV